MIDVLVAVDDALPREGLRACLDASGTTRVVEALDQLDDVLEAVDRHRPDVLILDAAFRRRSPSLLSRLADRHPECAVVVLARHRAEECIFLAVLACDRIRLSPDAIARLDECCLTSLQGAARGCIARSPECEEVLAVVETVAAGGVAAGPWMSAAARHAFRVDGVGAEDPITPRELEVMALVARGYSNKEVADRLGIQEQTAKNHLASLMNKLGVHSRLEVGLTAARYHLTLREEGGPA